MSDKTGRRRPKPKLPKGEAQEALIFATFWIMRWLLPALAVILVILVLLQHFRVL